MEATFPRWAAVLVGSGPRCAVLVLVVFLLATILLRFALPLRDLTARHRIIASTLWGLTISALTPGLVLTVAVRGGLLRGLSERLGDRAIGVAACLMAVHLFATLVVMISILRTRASWSAGCREQLSFGLVFLSRDQWTRFQSAVAAQWTVMVLVLLVGLVAVGAIGYGILWSERRIAFAVWSGVDLFAWITCLIGSGVLGGGREPTGPALREGQGPAEVLEQRRSP